MGRIRAWFSIYFLTLFALRDFGFAWQDIASHYILL
jgi:hypothetical protein